MTEEKEKSRKVKRKHENEKVEYDIRDYDGCEFGYDGGMEE